ncbi:MAG: hypothetical protein AAF418_01995 [Pseudomonadota bacterium]
MIRYVQMIARAWAGRAPTSMIHRNNWYDWGASLGLHGLVLVLVILVSGKVEPSLSTTQPHDIRIELATVPEVPEAPEAPEAPVQPTQLEAEPPKAEPPKAEPPRPELPKPAPPRPELPKPAPPRPELPKPAPPRPELPKPAPPRPELPKPAPPKPELPKPAPPKPEPPRPEPPKAEPPKAEPPRPDLASDQVASLLKSVDRTEATSPQPSSRPQNTVPDSLKRLREDFFAEAQTAQAAQANSDASTTPVSEPQYDANQGLSADEISALRQQIAGCWNLPAGAALAETLRVQLRIKVGPDRNVREVKIIDQARMSRNAFFRIAAESAQRAVLHPDCQPLMLPVGKYELWNDILFTFDPASILR